VGAFSEKQFALFSHSLEIGLSVTRLAKCLHVLSPPVLQMHQFLLSGDSGVSLDREVFLVQCRGEVLD